MSVAATPAVGHEPRFAYPGGVAGRGEPGGLEVVCGPMFSGKTDALITRHEHARGAGTTVVAFKPVRDARHAPDRIVSHSGREIPAVSVGSPDEVAVLGGSREL